MNLKEFRAAYPAYDDLDDDTLASALHKTHYKDIPRRQFDVQIGLRGVSTALHGRQPVNLGATIGQQGLIETVPQRTARRMQEVTAPTPEAAPTLPASTDRS